MNWIPLFRPYGQGFGGQANPARRGILHHAEGVDLIPSNIELAGMEVGLVNAMSRKKILKQVLDVNKRSYDFILLDCTPSLEC